MADPTSIQEPQIPAQDPEASLWLRLLWMILIAMMLGLAQTVLQVTAIIQIILMATRKGRPNVEIAWFGKRMGGWMAKAVRYLTAADDEKPWPWTPLD